MPFFRLIRCGLPLVCAASGLPLAVPAQVPTPPLAALQLPTDNRALFDGPGDAFYQFVDRTFEGEKSTPWEGGQFGFVRDPRRVGGQIAYARFHEGLDIKPLQRDAAGEPLDEVRAILGGSVVHVSNSSSASNYGRYVVVEHNWGEGPFFSLYAHLASIAVEVGARLTPGQALGRMGYTGAGIDKRRAHLHVELNLLWSSDFESWASSQLSSANRHGNYNGMNLIGLDLAALYGAQRKDPALSLTRFIRTSPAYFEVAIPGTARMEIAQRYPWLVQPQSASSPPASWRVTFTRWGLPVLIRPGSDTVAAPAVTAVHEDPLPHALNTRGLVTGSGREAKLTASGLQFLRLACGLP